MQFVGSGGSALRKQRLPKSMAELATEIGRERWTLSPGPVGVEMVDGKRTYVLNFLYLQYSPQGLTLDI